MIYFIKGEQKIRICKMKKGVGRFQKYNQEGLFCFYRKQLLFALKFCQFFQESRLNISKVK